MNAWEVGRNLEVGSQRLRFCCLTGFRPHVYQAIALNMLVAARMSSIEVNAQPHPPRTIPLYKCLCCSTD